MEILIKHHTSNMGVQKKGTKTKTASYYWNREYYKVYTDNFWKTHQIPRKRNNWWKLNQPDTAIQDHSKIIEGKELRV